MPKLIIEDLSLGLDDNGFCRDSYNSNTQQNKLTQKGSLVKYSLCNPFISIGSLGLFSSVDLTNSDNLDALSYSGNTPNAVGLNEIGQPIIACRNTTNPGVVYSVTESTSGEEGDISLVNTGSFIPQGEYPLAVARFSITGNNSTTYGYGTFVLARTLSTGGSPKMYLLTGTGYTDISSFITSFTSAIDLIPKPNEVLTPMICSEKNVLYTMNNKYISRLEPTGVFVGQVVEAPIGSKFKSMLEYGGKLWIAGMFKTSVTSRDGSSTFTNPTCAVYIWNHKFRTQQGFDNTLYVHNLKHIIDFILLEDTPTIIGINNSNKLVILKFDGTRFKQIKLIGDTFGDVIVKKTNTGYTFSTSETIISGTKSTIVPYNNGIAFVTDRGILYWIGKINSSTDKYSMFNIASIKSINSTNTVELTNALLLPTNTNLTILAQSNHEGSTKYYLYRINPLASDKCKSNISKIRFSDLQVPGGTVITNVKLLISGDNTGYTFTDSELIKVTLTGDGRNPKQFSFKAQDAIKRGYISIPYSNVNASRVGITIETNLVGYANLHKLPVLDRIEIDYKQSTIK